MNKKEVDKLAWIISDLRAGNLTTYTAADELAELCPKAGLYGERLMEYTLFEVFYRELVSYLMVQRFGIGWSLQAEGKEEKTDAMNRFHREDIDEAARFAFGLYVEKTGMRRPFQFREEYKEAFKSNEWREAVNNTADEFNMDLEFLL